MCFHAVLPCHAPKACWDRIHLLILNRTDVCKCQLCTSYHVREFSISNSSICHCRTEVGVQLAEITLQVAHLGLIWATFGT